MLIYNIDSWSTKGVSTTATGEEKYFLCQTTHLTNFALIIDVSQTQANPLALQLITWIGCGISLGGLLLTLISYGAFRYNLLSFLFIFILNLLQSFWLLMRVLLSLLLNKGAFMTSWTWKGLESVRARHSKSKMKGQSLYGTTPV